MNDIIPKHILREALDPYATSDPWNLFRRSWGYEELDLFIEQAYAFIETEEARQAFRKRVYADVERGGAL